MKESCTIQLHADGAWHDVASVRLLGPADAGWRARTDSGYAVEWAFEHPGARDGHALCAQWPVGLEPLRAPHWPVFLNLALGNKDNHARNTAVQRDFDGHIALAPLYDFAPMYLHPDGIARRIRWEDNDGGRPDWGRVLDRLCALGEQTGTARRGRKARNPIDRQPLVDGLKAMVPALERIASQGLDLGLEPAVLEHLRPSLHARARELTALH